VAQPSISSLNFLQAGLEVLKRKRVNTGGRSDIGVVVIGTVGGNMHDIGKDLVGMLLECARTIK